MVDPFTPAPALLLLLALKIRNKNAVYTIIGLQKY